ncbi:d-galactonate transporter [Salmonella enterica subsp. enterica serovar Paratyphi B str. SARA42]|nr:d-galactonate transporter [Salmonella enterica subsp. enterica serovar Paratyphi B str. SARA42]
MSSLSHAASSAEKRTNARYWIVVMLFIVTSFNYGDRATLSIAGSEMAKDIGLDPVGMGYVFSAFHGPMLSGRSRAAGCWTALVPNASISGLFSFGQSSPCCRVLSISLVVSALLSPSLRFVSWLVWRNRLLSRATVALLQPGSRRRRGERRWPSLTPRNTLPRLFSRRLWAG